jgi:hypothetical protein
MRLFAEVYMFHPIKKVHAYLRLRRMRKSNPSSCFYFNDSQMFLTPKVVWYVDAYYAVRHFFHDTCNPRNWYREVKYFIQRGRRGWADCDTWSLDEYLSKWLPDALRYLKTHKHGIPSEMIHSEDGVDEHGCSTDAAFALGEARWDAIMEKMIAGFEADMRIKDGCYEDELGEYPLSRPTGVSVDSWERVRRNHREASKILMARDEALFQEGMQEFIKNYRNLWD